MFYVGRLFNHSKISVSDVSLTDITLTELARACFVCTVKVVCARTCVSS